MDGDPGRQQSKKSRGLRAAALRGGLGPDPRALRAGDAQVFLHAQPIRTMMEERDTPTPASGPVRRRVSNPLTTVGIRYYDLIMTMICRFPIHLTTAFLIALLISPCAWADEPSCGTTAREALATAEQALSNTSAQDHDRAIVCLLQVVKDLEAHRCDVARSKGSRSLIIPSYSSHKAP